MAALWRSETNRLANSMDIKKASNILLATHHRDRRQSFISQFVDDFLSTEPIQWLLREPSSKEEENKRERKLCNIYMQAMEKAAEMGNIRGHLEFHRLAELPETFTLGERMVTHEYNCLPKGSTRIDGHRILMVVYPGIVRRYICARDRYITEYSTKAYVVVEKRPKGKDQQK